MKTGFWVQGLSGKLTSIVWFIIAIVIWLVNQLLSRIIMLNFAISIVGIWSIMIFLALCQIHTLRYDFRTWISYRMPRKWLAHDIGMSRQWAIYSLYRGTQNLNWKLHMTSNRLRLCIPRSRLYTSFETTKNPLSVESPMAWTGRTSVLLELLAFCRFLASCCFSRLFFFFLSFLWTSFKHSHWLAKEKSSCKYQVETLPKLFFTINDLLELSITKVGIDNFFTLHQWFFIIINWTIFIVMIVIGIICMSIVFVLIVICVVVLFVIIIIIVFFDLGEFMQGSKVILVFFLA